MKQASAAFAGLGDDRAVPHRDGVHAVHRLDDAVPAHLDDDRLRHARQPTCGGTVPGAWLANGRDMPYIRRIWPVRARMRNRRRTVADYDADETLVVSERAQLRALADDVRAATVALLRERAHSTQQLSAKLGIPKGTVGHHLKVLEQAGLIRVVRTRKVRALTESFYGRTAHLFLFQIRGRGRRPRARRERPPPGRRPRSGARREIGGFGHAKARLDRRTRAGFERRLKRLLDDFRAADVPGRRALTRSLGALYAPAAMRSLRRPSGGLWAHADFLKLWTGQSISELGSQVSGLAIPWLAAAGLHASPLEFSLLTVLGFLPFILFALPAGVWVDRLRRRPILIAGDAARAVLLGYVPLAWALGILTIGQLLVDPVRRRSLHGLLRHRLPVVPPRARRGREQLVEGNSKLQTTAAAAGVAGPGLAGVLIGVLTAPYAIALDAASFVVSTAFMIPIRAVETHRPSAQRDAPRPKMLPELKEGLAYVVRHPAPALDRRLHRRLELLRDDLDGDRPALHAARAARLVVLGRAPSSPASVSARSSARSRRRGSSAPSASGARSCIPTVLFSFAGFAYPLAPHGTRAVPVLLAGTLVFGYASMAYNITQVSYRQAITPQRIQGRMNASMRWIVWGTMPIGSILGGAIATAVSMRAALWVGAIGGTVALLPILLTSVRSIAEMPDAPPDDAPAEAEPLVQTAAAARPRCACLASGRGASSGTTAASSGSWPRTRSASSERR